MMKKESILLTNVSIYMEDKIIDDGYLKISGGVISEIGLRDESSRAGGGKIIQLPDGYKVIPGMIDVHIHGVNGADVMDAETKALQVMADTLPQEGTTSFLATTITQDQTAISQALGNVWKFMSEGQLPGQAEVLGVHLEGPFINAAKAGAQPAAYISEPDLELFKKWQNTAGNQIKLVTLAPEQPEADKLIRYLKETGIIASIGHSNASFEQTSQAVDAGLSHATHLYNQMSGLHHREPGAVGAVLLDERITAEIIADGIHVRPEAIALAYRQKTADKMVLITDAIRAKCLKNGTYDLGGQEVTVKDEKALLADGTLAGSVIKMGQAFQNIIAYTSCSIEEAIKMSSTNAAKELGIENRKGSIAVGKDADLVVLDENNQIVMTFCRGQLAYKKGEEEK